MGTRGRLPSSTSDYSQRKHAGTQPVPQLDCDLPAARAAFAPIMGKHGLRLWDTTAEQLRGVGLLGATDVPAFMMLCSQYHFWREAMEHLHDEGHIETGPRGGTKLTPWLRAADVHFRAFEHLSDKFGMNPAARKRLRIPRPEHGKESGILKLTKAD